LALTVKAILHKAQKNKSITENRLSLRFVTETTTLYANQF